MFTLPRVLMTLILVATSLVRADAQVVGGDDGEQLDTMGYVDEVPGQPEGVPGVGSEGAPAQPESERMKKLKTLIFDRRPSSILEAWSKPPEPSGAAPSTDVSAGTNVAAGNEAVNSGETTIEKADESAGTGADSSSSSTVSAETDVTHADKTPSTAPETEEAKQAREAAEKAKADAQKKADEAKLLEAELKRFQRFVTLGDWNSVKEYLKSLPEAEGNAGYSQMLRSLLQGPPPRPPQNQQMQAYVEKNQITLPDILDLAAASPVKINKDHEKNLGALLVLSLSQGNLLERFLEIVRAELDKDEFPLKRRDVVRILMAAGQPIACGEFLPKPEHAEENNDREGLNLLSDYYVKMHEKEKKGGWLEKAWKVTLAALAAGEITDEDKQLALKRAVYLAPKVRDELGEVWLHESFTSRPERGMEILAVLGAQASDGLYRYPQDVDFRAQGLELQTTAATALLEVTPERAKEWRKTLHLLASNWLKEAVFTYQYDQSTQRGPRMQRDMYGNWFYYNDGDNNYPYQNNQMPRAIATGRILEIRPADTWLEHVDEGLRPKFSMVLAQLLLKVGEEGEAFPHIERLAATHADPAKDLVHEFLRVWTRNHTPDEQRSRTNSYSYFYGYEERASGIPLMRSKQERNLTELAQWVKRIKGLPLEDLDDKLIAEAFTTAHSSAEVYRLDNIEKVFGPLEGLEPKTLASLIQKMRTNLVSVWKQPDVQKEKKTNRRQKDIQAEVLRGYEVARAVVAEGTLRHPEDWSLALAKASLEHDENGYRAELEKSSEFSERRLASFDSFRAAADLYAKQVPQLDVEEESTEVYEIWMYAALGACDLGAVDPQKQLVAREIPSIRAAIAALGGETAERHLAKFASTLFTRMSNVNPAVKFRYVRAGLEITGEHERAREAREVYDYYKDLVTEIQLVARVDGSDVVGSSGPFGVFVDLRHTREIERESGGFAKYLTNQNNMSYAFNYGRPTENYRDKFEETARETLKEHFDVQSITFNHPDAHSKAEEEYGWRVTPYAYLLIKPRGPEVDKIPALRLDLDFLDTSGYVVLPIESSVVPIDAREPRGEARPFADLSLTQTLDERQSKQGKLILEVRARAHGLVPALDSILDLSPKGFDIQSVDDQGASVVEFEKETEEIALLCERTWMVTFAGRKDLARLPETFTFGTPRVETKELLYQRFVDADLAKAEKTISLDASYGERRSRWPMITGLATLALLAAAGVVFVLRRRPKMEARARFHLPETVTPFTAIGFLRELATDGVLGETDRTTLASQIESLERFYFADQAGEQPDLDAIVSTWLRRAS